MPKFFRYGILLIIFLGLVSCQELLEDNPITVDAIFQEKYQSLGGEEILGPAISQIYEKNGRKFQFTSKVSMVYDPEINQFYLAPIGNEILKIAEHLKYPNHYDIYAAFEPLHMELGGILSTGRVLSDVIVDMDHKRIVQYFENVGFYQMASDPPGVVHLLDYGAWKCAQACGYHAPKESSIGSISANEAGIASTPERLNPIFTGDPLSEIYVGSDGLEERIYENVVIYRDYASPGGIALRPLPELLEIPAETPQANTSEEEGVFIASEGDLGFYVPNNFDEYIRQYYGYLFIGHPINKFVKINEGLYRQCFENLCLDYRPDESEDQKIHPMALGRKYKQVIAREYIPKDGVDPFTGITLTIQKISPVVPSGKEQEISVLALKKGIPLSKIVLSLTVAYPDSCQQTQLFQPTKDDGTTGLEVNCSKADKGTPIKFKICAEEVEESVDCVEGEYLIWGEIPETTGEPLLATPGE